MNKILANYLNSDEFNKRYFELQTEEYKNIDKALDDCIGKYSLDVGNYLNSMITLENDIYFELGFEFATQLIEIVNKGGVVNV